MLEPLVVKATRAVPRRERGSNPPDLSKFSYEKPTFILYFSILSIEIFLFSYGVIKYFIKLKMGLLKGPV